MDKPIKIKLIESTKLSLDAVNSEEVKKGTVLTSSSTLQRRLFEHLIESGKADEYSPEAEAKQTKKTKATKPKSKKSTKSKK
jgi:aspartate/glutamate racemase